MKSVSLPLSLSSSVSSEKKDFAVKAGRAKPLKKSLSSIIFGIVWIAFSSIFVFSLIAPVFQGKEVNFKVNGVPTVAGPDNLDPIMLPAIVIGIFVLVGIAVLIQGIYSLFQKGGYFVGTPSRLVFLKKGKIRSIDWEQFSGDIEVSGNDQKGNIALKMRTGKMVSKEKGPDKYVPDVIYILEISNVFEVEQICRKRIKENDPTPAKTEHSIA